ACGPLVADADDTTGDKNGWITVGEFVVGAPRAKQAFGAEGVAKARDAFARARQAFLAHDREAFAKAGADFAAVLDGFGKTYREKLAAQRGTSASAAVAGSRNMLDIFNWLDGGNHEWDAYPSPAQIDREVFYNGFDPFHKTWLLSFLAVLVLST